MGLRGTGRGGPRRRIAHVAHRRLAADYNRPDPLLPDLIVCRPELAEAVLAVTR